MSLTRVHDPLSLALVRRLGDAGGPRADEVAAELDSLIAWAGAALRRIHSSFPSPPTGNNGAGPDTLHSFSLDTPNRLLTNGDYLRVRYAGLFAGDADTKRIETTFGGQTVSALAQAQNGSLSWVYDVTYGRVSATTVRYASSISWGRLRVPNGGALADEGLFTGEQGLITVANLNSNAMTLALLGGDANSETDDVQLSQAIIELYQQ